MARCARVSGARAAEPWSLAAAAEIVAAAVDSLDRGPALVVGHSLGGYASLEFARRTPERSRGLVLAGAGASTSGPWAVPYRWVAGLVPRLSADRLGRFDAGAMSQVDAPVLVLNGEKDTVFRSGERAFVRAHPRARLELIPRAGHLANFDDPAAFTAAVRRFARQLPVRP
ncbi:alpha/beta fold hydrolase [Streptomyces liangshanensis]|uniref:alpha/beta fold hydrolase n=1 Tax=Streptomyces liangshanensis TaxID=2717324 RepID=UPI0036DF9457